MHPCKEGVIIKVSDVLTYDGRYYVDKKGFSYETAEEYIGTLLGFCGCGDPDAALVIVYKVLRSISKHNYDLVGVFEANIEDGIVYFIYYMLTDKKLLEHGSSIPGWLTQKGKDILDLLEETGAVRRDTPSISGDM